VSTVNKKTRTVKKPAGKKKAKKTLSLRWILWLFLIALLLSPFYYGHIIKSVTSAWRSIREVGSNPNYRNYKSFDIHIPTNYKIHGIDVSSYQGTIDWKRVKNMREDSVHISFAFIKATEGIIQADPFFQRNWREAHKAGITCGAYHYFRPKFSGKWQAVFFLQIIKSVKGDLPITVDIEELDGVSPENMREQLTVFLKQTEAKTKTKPIIYTGLKFYQDNLSGYFDGYPLWIANYRGPDLDMGNTTKWKFWQHSDNAKVNGISRSVDFDVFNGDSLTFKRLLIK
jgi:lysozyme